MAQPLTTEKIDMGPCCICEKEGKTVRHIIMLDFQMPDGCRSGWGCLQCGLEMKGAAAVVCDECLEKHKYKITENLKFVISGGSPKEKNRFPISKLKKVYHGHDHSKHPEITLH